MAEKSDLAPAYLIFGTDTPKVRLAVARFKRRVVQESGSDLSITSVDAGTASAAPNGSQVVDLLQTGSFVPGRRAVVVERADAWRAAERNKIAAYLADPYPETTVVLVGETFDPKEQLFKVVKQVGDVLHYDLPTKRNLAIWAQELARGMRLRLPQAEAGHLLHVVGEEPLRVQSELRKLADYVGARPDAAPVEVGRADIDAVCSPGLEAQMWDLTDAVGKRDAGTALRVLEELLAIGGAPRQARASGTDPTRSIFAALRSHIDLLRQVGELPPGSSSAEVGQKLRIHPYRARRLQEQRETFSDRMIERATIVLADADAELVGASQLEPELVLERALVRLVG
jgi:DNA polymerase-3 subunit delta